jgi:hypothetical protein
MDGIGDGAGRACLRCQAALSPHARFCPRCGEPAELAAAGGPQPAAGPPPGEPGAGLGEGPGFTVVSPPDPAPPAGWGAPAAGWPGPARADWDDQTVTRFPARPFPAPLARPARPQDAPYAPPGYDPAYEPPGLSHDGPAYGPASPGQAPPAPQGYEQGYAAAGYESGPPYEPAGPTAWTPGPDPAPGPLSGPAQGPPRQPPRRHDRDRSGSPLALWIILLALLLGGGAAAGLLIAHPFSHPSLREAASTGGTPAASASSAPASRAAAAGTTPASSPSASASAPAVTEQQAATTVAAMLKQSVSDRAAISQAYANVMACDTAQLPAAPSVFDNAATSRQRMLASLGTLPGRATLPPALLSDLTQAWQASIAADQAFAQWASDELAGCTPNDTGSPAYQATVAPDDNATKYKTAFVAQWNPVAARYGLTPYSQQQL